MEILPILREQDIGDWRELLLLLLIMLLMGVGKGFEKAFTNKKPGGKKGGWDE
jgi:hypothetical protein